MSQTRPNGIVVPVNSDTYNPTANLAAMADTSNVVAPVVDQAAQDALEVSGLLYPGYIIVRTDLTSMPQFMWDGTDWEQKTGLRTAAYTGPIVNTTAGVGTTVGALTVDATKTISNDFVQPDIAGRLKVLKTGVYAGAMIIRPATSPGVSNVYIADITAGVYVAASVGGNYGTKEVSVSFPNLYVTANTVLEFGLVTTNAVALGSLVTMTKWQ